MYSSNSIFMYSFDFRKSKYDRNIFYWITFIKSTYLQHSWKIIENRTSKAKRF